MACLKTSKALDNVLRKAFESAVPCNWYVLDNEIRVVLERNFLVTMFFWTRFLFRMVSPLLDISSKPTPVRLSYYGIQICLLVDHETLT